MTAAQLAADVRRGNVPVVPDALQTALAARDRLLELQTTQPPRETHAEAFRAILEHTLANGDVPDGFEDRLFEAQHGVDRAQHRSLMIGTLAQRVDNIIPRIVGEHLDAMLDGLRVRLQPVLGSLREAYPLLAGFEDLDAPDGDRLATADEETRGAFVTVTEQTAAYRTIRRMQLDLLTMGSPVPGNASLATYTWQDVARQGVLELRNLDEPGLPGAGRGRRSATRDVVTRPDVWLPSRSELAAAWLVLFGDGQRMVTVNDLTPRPRGAIPTKGALISIGGGES